MFTVDFRDASAVDVAGGRAGDGAGDRDDTADSAAAAESPAAADRALNPVCPNDTVAVEWHRTDAGLERRVVDDYCPTIYVSGPDAALTALGETVADWPAVAGVDTERWRTSLHADPDEREAVLRIDTAIGAPARVARRIRDEYEPDRHAPGTLKLYNVDFEPGLRYALATEPDPMPGEDASLRVLRIGLGKDALAERNVSALRIDGEVCAGSGTGGGTGGGEGGPEASLRTLARRLREGDPDVLVVSSADLIPLLAERAVAHDVSLPLSRDGDVGADSYAKLAGRSTFESYGRTGHSPSRYAVPGRAIVDTSSSFLWAEARLDGLSYLARRSARPLQETAWASIGTILTAIQTREALARGVLVPWQKWEPEAFVDVGTLHAGDRGGATLAPNHGRYENVREVDFASLYPNVIREYNVSPETVACDCCDTADVPELGWSICEEPGFLGDVLGPLLDDRAWFKRVAAAAERAGDDALAGSASAKSAAIKWILVSCFGYQGYRNAKFGRIECHEAINAYARDVLLAAKERFEAGGWRAVHGIVDSLWVTPDDEHAESAPRDPEPAADLAADVTDAVDVELEVEAEYDWLCLLPRRNDGGPVGGRGGALTRYFGRKAGVDADPATGEGYKYRGIECRQRSTPEFVADCQRELIDVLDSDPRPEAVCDRLSAQLQELRSGAVDPADLTIRTRLSKAPAEYSRNTRTAAALRRAEDTAVTFHAGQDVEYVVTDDDADRQLARVRLAFEDPTDYDAEAYAEQLIRAAESVTLPFGWDRGRIRTYLAGDRNASLSAF
ncbi:type B DNA-directed DNA polymerase [Haloparvum sp. PAK95]|uniref:type B DNA-directed DNA polymerase n=1 Tax=Haloparvum sp. PAK95 TaxID=3418962 RepID=UPI003D2EECD3